MIVQHLFILCNEASIFVQYIESNATLQTLKHTRGSEDRLFTLHLFCCKGVNLSLVAIGRVNLSLVGVKWVNMSLVGIGRVNLSLVGIRRVNLSLVGVTLGVKEVPSCNIIRLKLLKPCAELYLFISG